MIAVWAKTYSLDMWDTSGRWQKCPCSSFSAAFACWETNTEYSVYKSSSGASPLWNTRAKYVLFAVLSICDIQFAIGKRGSLGEVVVGMWVSSFLCSRRMVLLHLWCSIEVRGKSFLLLQIKLQERGKLSGRNIDNIYCQCFPLVTVDVTTVVLSLWMSSVLQHAKVVISE